jgi:(2Fe-2S) ferredoxin
MADDDALIGRAMGLESYERHVFVCKGPRCCTLGQAQEAWGALNQRLGELVRAGKLDPTAVRRTQVGCLKVCRSGPVGVVYPDGVWYRGLTAEACERLADEHLARGEVLDEHAFARNPRGTAGA